VETVLVVEDEWTVRNLTARVLERSGYSVLVASDGYEALRVAAAHEGPLHLLLTDLVMPRLGGIELARRLRDSRPEMAVLYSSGYGEVPADRRGDTVEGAELIEKPYGPDALARKVREALDAAREGVR
jgi:CheY-like chemotaxis protein